MKKAFKPITHVNQLVGGQLYVQVGINEHGFTWMKVLQVMGKPFKAKEPQELCFGSTYKPPTPEIQVMTKTIRIEDFECPHIPLPNYPSSIGIVGERRKYGGLYPYSNAVCNHLTILLEERRKLMEFNFGGPLTDEQVRRIVFDWENRIRSDNTKGELSVKLPGVSSFHFETYFINDKSVNGFMTPTSIERATC